MEHSEDLNIFKPRTSFSDICRFFFDFLTQRTVFSSLVVCYVLVTMFDSASVVLRGDRLLVRLSSDHTNCRCRNGCVRSIPTLRHHIPQPSLEHVAITETVLL